MCGKGTILEQLQGVNAYPLPVVTLRGIAVARGLDPDETAYQDTLQGKTFNLAVADVLMWLSFAPDVSQGGQSYSFTDEQRQQFRSRAKALYAAYGDDEASKGSGVVYGYKGSRL